MEDKGLIFWGTFGLLAFNVLLVILAVVAFKSLSVLWASIFVAPFAIAAIYFDVVVVKYFIAKIKERKNKKKNE